MTIRDRWLAAAEIVDAWRVVPRIMLFAYCVWTAKVVGQVLDWYMALPADERSIEASGLAGAIVATVTGLSTAVFGLYIKGGRNWDVDNQPTK